MAASVEVPSTPVYEAPAKQEKGIDIMKLFPAAFTTACGLLFLAPSYIIVRNAVHPDIMFFSSDWYWILAVIPVIIISTHMKHVRSGAPNKYAVIASLVVPSVILLILGNFQYSSAADKADKLFSTDCNTFPMKTDLQRAWVAAYDTYQYCLETTANSSQYDVATLQQHFRLQDCMEYNQMLQQHPTWSYLRLLEERNQCSGWCYHAIQLWGSTHTRDSCSNVVASVYMFDVRPHTAQVCLIMVTALLVTFPMLMLLGPVMRAHGFEW